MKKENFKHNHKNEKRAGDAGTRTCFVKKEALPRQDLLRFVVTPDCSVAFDSTEKLPGRGMWLSADRKLLEQAMTKHIFYKAAHGTVKIPEDLPAQVERALRNRCIELLGLSRKAGLLVFGYEAVKKAVAGGEAVVAFEASDSSEREQSKIFKSNDTLPIYTCLTRAELGKIAGQDEIVHVALSAGRLSDEAVCAAHRLALFEGLLEQKG